MRSTPPGSNLGAHFLSVSTTDALMNTVQAVLKTGRFRPSVSKNQKACGEDFVVQVLMNCVEENDNLTNNATLATLDNAVTEPHNRTMTIEEGIGLPN